MHITLIALGSRGDVQPLISLGGGLRAAGHRVCLATFENFAPLAVAAGLDHLPMPGDAQALTAAGGADMPRLARSFGGLARGYARSLTAVTQLKTDLIVNQLPGGLFGYDLAERLGVPQALAAVMPLTATTAFPALGFPALRLPGYNRLSYRLAEQALWAMFRAAVNEWRVKTLGLRPSPFTGYFGKLARGAPILNGFSAHLVTRPPDWGGHVHVTGYWYPEPAAWQPPAGLERFIDSGPLPVFVGFGSMPVKNPAGTTRLVTEALQSAGLRAILHVGWAGLGEADLPPTIHRIEDTPYDWLFPRLAAIAHHGGSGATHFGARAGVPSFVVPFVYDQFFWGQRLAALGAGPAPIPFARLSAERLAGALAQAATDASMRTRAAALGAAVRSESGLAQAVTLCESFLARC